MNLDFTDLEVLAQRSLSCVPEVAWIEQAQPQYQNAPLAEVFDLLESAVESYAVVMPSLAPQLQESARQEIEFFFSLLQERLNALLDRPYPEWSRRLNHTHCAALLTF